MLKRRHIVVLASSLLTVGGSAMAQKQRDDAVPAIELVEDLRYDITVHAGTPSERTESRQVRRGTFVAEEEDDDGTWFRNTRPSVVWWTDRGRNLRVVQDGGIWMSRSDALRRFRPYVYLESALFLVERAVDSQHDAENIPEEDALYAQAQAGVPNDKIGGPRLTLIEAIVWDIRRNRSRRTRTLIEEPPTGVTLEGTARFTRHAPLPR